MSLTRILIINDELSVIQRFIRGLSPVEYSVDSVLSPVEAMSRIDQTDYDVVFFDLNLVAGDGMQLFNRLLDQNSTTAVVLLISTTQIQAFDAMKHANCEFLPKTFSPEELTDAVQRALLNHRNLLQLRNITREEIFQEHGELVGTGAAMRSIYPLIKTIAPSGACVMIIGEDGTGRRLVAQAIHRLSPRKLEPFVAVESEIAQGESLGELIFGRMEHRGHAARYLSGKADEAGSGTLYFDEITALSLRSQKLLLNAIQKRSITPFDSTTQRRVSCRFIIATAKNLNYALDQGELLADLHHSLSVFPIYVPSLAERVEDIPYLVSHFINRYSPQYGSKVEGVDKTLMARLTARHWSGNVRELAWCVERMISLCNGDVLMLTHYEQVMEKISAIQWHGRPPATVKDLKRIKKQLRQTAVVEVERAFITNALRRSGGNISRAAREVGMERRNFQTMMRQHGIRLQ